MRGLSALACLLATALGSWPLAAQAGGGGYADEGARTLHAAAVAAWARTDSAVIRYTAVVRRRIGASLRTPLKDRTLYRAESAHRLFWSRDGETVVQALALREQGPLGRIDDAEDSPSEHFDQMFDPSSDRLLFGFTSREELIEEREEGDADIVFEHPLDATHADAYRFSSGDTLTLSLPDGRRVQAVELRVVPVVADIRRISGSLWIEPGSGALVRGMYRLSETFDAFRDVPELREDEDMGFVPGIFKPWTAEISLVVVDYALWNFDVWLPRSLRAEGVISAGILHAPVAVDVSYEMESVLTQSDVSAPRDDATGEPLEEVHFRKRSEAMAYLAELLSTADVPYVAEPRTMSVGDSEVRYVMPADPAVLAESPELPPPIWEDAPGFHSEDELNDFAARLADLPRAPPPVVPTTFRWGLQQPDLVRYNRVEGLSIGARGQARPHVLGQPLSLSATVRLGSADLVPNVRMEVARETLERKLTFAAYHELAAIDEDARHLGLGNSLVAAVVGRDDGDYYRRSGVSLGWTPPAISRESFRVEAFAEHHRGVTSETSVALFHLGSSDWAFRDNIAADRGWEYGADVELSPWWGTDPNLLQGGVEVGVRAAVGDFEYVRASLLGRLAVPLPADLRIGVEAGIGSTWGSPSAQRLWYLGGPSTLRGYDPRRLAGESLARGRVELARRFPFGALSLFSDVGWAGRAREASWSDALSSLGAGVSILDGLIRLDAAWGLRGPSAFRFDMYLDAIL